MPKKSQRAMCSNGRDEWRQQLDFLKSKYTYWNRVALQLQITPPTVYEWLDFPHRIPRTITLNRIREVAITNGWKQK